MTDKTSTENRTESAQSSSGDAGSVILNGEYEIFPSQRLQNLDKGPVKAWSARGKDGKAFFALVCERDLLPRTVANLSYRRIINPSLVPLAAAGIVPWPSDNAERYVYVYENILGDPLVTDKGSLAFAWKPELVAAAVVQPLISVFQDFRDKDLFHGAVRLDNFYDGGTQKIERVILGECLSSPPSALQPVLYEPLERAMTEPEARGVGSKKDDLYAFGVCLALLLRKQDPMEGFTDREILEHKLEIGSYSALLGETRISGGLLELLRGLLYDDPEQRWSVEEILAWMDGRRLSPKQALKRQKAARPIVFQGTDYFRPQILAMDLDQNAAELVKLVDGREVEQWLKRSIDDKPLYNRYEAALTSAREQGRDSGYAERLSSLLSIAFYPEAPIQFQGSVFHPDGFGNLLVSRYLRKKDLNSLLAFINTTIITWWLQNQTDSNIDIGGLVSRFDSARAFLRQTNPGYGLERCLYFLCQNAPCLSEALAKFYVRTPEDLLMALEKIAQGQNRPTTILDRHMIAFLSVRDRKVIDFCLSEFAADEDYRKITATLMCLATIQKRSNMDTLPNLADWIFSKLEKIYVRFHDRELRETLRKQIEKHKSHGDLLKMVSLVESQGLRDKDFQKFKSAMGEFYQLRSEYNMLEKRLKDKKKFGKNIQQEIAAVVSGALSALVVLAFTFMHLGNGSGFFP